MHGVTYEQCELSKSDLYLAAIPLMNSKRVELPTHDRMEREFRRLERKRGRGGKDAIQDGGRHDDLANAIVGALHLASAGKIFNPRAVPLGVGGSHAIGTQIRRELGSSFGPRGSFVAEPTRGHRIPVPVGVGSSGISLGGDDRELDEEPARVAERYRFRWGWGSDD